MKTLTKVLAGITLSISVFTAFSNELTNGDFESSPPTSNGNNVGYSVAPWTFTGSAQANVVHVDGPGGRPYWNGPESDATGSGSGVWRNYLDVDQGGSGTVYQSFTVPEECSGEVRFGGYFSARNQGDATATLEIRNGNGLSGSVVGTTATLTIPNTNYRTAPWTRINVVATLSAGATYSFIAGINDNANFDEAYVNFVEGPCKDDSDIVDEPEQCLILEPKVECVANKWQVSINNSSSSFNADVLDITSQTSGVTISGSSPTWILNGALPNSSVDITVDGTVTGGGKADFADLCCTTKLHIDIPDEMCEIVQEKPHIYTRKAYVETEEGKGEFRFVLDSWVQLNDPMTLTITDTIPAGVTLTSLDSANTTNWSCPGLPVAGPGTLVCTYIGAMPIPAGTNFNVLVYADVEPSTKDRKNCIKTNLVDTNSAGIPYDGMKEGCAEIPAEEEVVDKEPEIKTEKTCELTPKFGRYQPFTCKITVTASNLLGGGTINLSDSIINSGFTSINATSSTENWLCDPTPSSTSPFDCSLTEAELISAGGTSVIYISGMSEETLRNCASSSYTNGVGEVSSEACWNVIDEDDTEECSPPNVLIEGHCELPCETDSQCSSIDGAACLPFYNTETLVCQQPEPPIVCGEGEMLVDGQCVTSPPEKFNIIKVCQTTPNPVNTSFTCKITVSGLGLDGLGSILLNDWLTNDGGGAITESSSNENWNCGSSVSVPPATSYDCTLDESDLVSAGGSSELIISGYFNIPFKNAKNCVVTTIRDESMQNQVPVPSTPSMCWKQNEEQQCVDNTDCAEPTPICTLQELSAGGTTNVCQARISPESSSMIEIDKFAPKTCKAGSKCKFTFTITNKTKKPYSGFVGITDKPRKRFGRIRGKSKGWSCKKKGREYRCGIDKLSLKPDESKKLTLTLQVPRSLSGKVENCATIEAESPVSAKSCVTVKIINNRQCGYDDKLVNGRCVARCKSKNSNWNGVDCMVCRGGKTWNDRYKRCDKKPKEVIKSCPDHYRWSTAQKRCVYIVPSPITKIPNCNKGTYYDSRKKRCVENARPKKCNKGTHYNAVKRRCVENSRPPACNKGTHYNAAKKRCVEDKRSHPTGCPAGQIYLSDIKRCVKLKKEHPKGGGGGGCGGGEIWNIIYKKCEKLPEHEGNDDGGHTGGGGGQP